MRLHSIPYSTNVARVTIALGLKGRVPDEIVQHAPGDRAALIALSRQPLVPVLETGDGQVLTDSMPIVEWIDRTWPQPHPLYPADPARRREVDGFITFFNTVWKVAPNAIAGERARPEPDEARIAAWAAQLRGWQHGFDALLHGRPYLFGDTPGAADVCAYPFLHFARAGDPGDDDDPFHHVLREHLAQHAGEHENLAAWIERMAEPPQLSPTLPGPADPGPGSF